MSSGEFTTSGVLLVAGGLSMALLLSALRLRKRLMQLCSVPAPVLRRITEMEDSDAGIRLHLECGHDMIMAVPTMVPCAQCSHEVNALKKMAGTK